jgi:aspartyl-tRNA(Asn)/glutamyl-tRNA(Gln) amidotransferase subunit C
LGFDNQSSLPRYRSFRDDRTRLATVSNETTVETPTAAFETLTAGPTLPATMTEEAVDPEEVAHVAQLARVALTESERDRFAEQFADVLDAFESLDDVPEVERDADLANVLRPDEVQESLDQREALSNASETEAGHFKGPPVS